MNTSLLKLLQYDMSINDINFSLSKIEMVFYALNRFEERFYCHADSEITNFIEMKIASYISRNQLKIITCFAENPSKCVSKIKLRLNGLLSDLPKYRKHSTSIDNLLILKKNGFMLINECDRFYNDPESDRFLASRSFDETED